MDVVRLHRIWLVSLGFFIVVLVGCSFVLYFESIVMSFVIAIVLAFLAYNVAFYLLCRTLCAKIRSHIITDSSSDGQQTTQYRGTGNIELDKYIARYFEARQVSTMILPPLLLIFLIALVALVTTG